MKYFFMCFVVFLSLTLSARAYVITINEADDSIFDFTVVDFNVPGGGGLYRAGLWEVSLVEHGSVGEFAVFGPDDLFNAFFAGFFIQGFGVVYFNGQEVTSVDRGFRFIYDAPGSSNAVPDSGRTVIPLLLGISIMLGLMKSSRALEPDVNSR
jgi:hypothetical protein